MIYNPRHPLLLLCISYLLLCNKLLQVFWLTCLGGSSLVFPMRLQSRFWTGLQLSEDLTGSEGSAFKVAHMLTGQIGPSCWEASFPLHGHILTWQLKSLYYLGIGFHQSKSSMRIRWYLLWPSLRSHALPAIIQNGRGLHKG